MSEAALSFMNVSFDFPQPNGNGKRVLESLNLQVAAGECLVILGPSGCGKSTLLRMAGGLIHPASGSVSSHGIPVLRPDPNRVMIFQEPRLVPWLRVRENLNLTGRITEQEAVGLLENLGLDPEILRMWPRELSGGMAQRVSLARAMAMKPKMMLLDEPLGALDIETRLGIQDLLARSWKEWGCTAVLVTHDIEEAVYLGDRIVSMGRDGRIRGSVGIPGPNASLRSRDSEIFARDLSAVRGLISGSFRDDDDHIMKEQVEMT